MTAAAAITLDGWDEEEEEETREKSALALLEVKNDDM
jgi:hypothetical protein